ncbi:unnamed protein product [Soboliphyme baturini]|uniref:NtA domain-containing protein n=1 Tax=Soboliphyme baturini TaxID=241478 RepID=A0A183IT43_9BILA|nr:unnamed protein product [Soboliphyme baturini]
MVDKVLWRWLAFVAFWLITFMLLSHCTRAYVVSCPDSATDISKTVQQSDFVLSGTVDQLLKCEDEHCHVKAKVRVLRVFKGQELLTDRRDDHVFITGINDPLTCDSSVKARDTKIFFSVLDPRYDEFRLISGLLSINIHNLDMVEAYSEGW